MVHGMDRPTPKRHKKSARRRSTTTSVPPLGQRERNKLEKLHRIRDAASALFKERGFDRTTTLAIAELADIGEGTLFLYARTKEDLLALVMETELTETLRKASASVPSHASLPVQALHVFTRLLRYHSRNKELSKYFVRQNTIPRRLKSRSRVVPLVTLIIDAMTTIVTEDQRRKSVRSDVVASDIGWCLFSIYYGALARFLNGEASLERSISYMKRSFTFLFEGLQFPGRAGR